MAITLNGTTGITTPKLDALDLELGSKNVVERGSNANGEYVRFADGTQICTIVGMTLSKSDVYNAVEFFWTFPAEFLVGTASVTSLGARNSGGDYVGFSTGNPILQLCAVHSAADGGTATMCRLMCIDGLTAGAAAAVHNVRASAIGRWF